MVWGKRRFKYAEYSPYFDRLEKLLMSNATQYREFIMVSVDTSEVGASDIYVGVPNKAFMVAFDGFELVEEADLPRTIDTLLIADATTDEFKTRFEFRHNRRARA